MQETQVQPQGQEDPLEKGMATRSSILAWRIAWTEEPGGIQSMGSQRVGHDWVTNTRKGNMCKICLYAWNQHKSTTDILSDFLKSWSFCLAVPFLVLVTQSCPAVCKSHGLQPARFLCPWDSPGKKTGMGCHFLLQGYLADPGIEPGSPALQADSLSSEPPGKPLIKY